MIRALFALAGDIAELPRTGWGVVGVLILTIPPLVTAIGTVAVLVRQHKSASQVGEIKAQVVNGHEDPMRTDIDRANTKLDGLIVSVAELAGEMRGLTHRVDLLAERRGGGDRRVADVPVEVDRRQGERRAPG